MPAPDPQSLLTVLQTLLGPEGCPWDREQTPESLCDYLIEEVFELVEAVRSGDASEIQDELGDAFFLLFFLSVLLESGNGFSLDEVWKQSAAKMIGRHPHVFSQASFANREELMQNWEEVKKREKEQKNASSGPENVLESIPASLPPLVRSYRIQAKAAKLGFSWSSHAEQDWAFQREWQEWEQVRDREDFETKEEEFGDVLFSLVEHGRRRGLKANAALQRANQKFLNRFRSMLSLARDKGLDWEELDLEARDALWEEVKARQV